MKKILVFAGTTEGYEITEFLAAHQVPVHMCVATDYGSTRFKQEGSLTISHDRLNEEEMQDFIRREGFSLVIDATHPYAVAVTDNIKAACRKTDTPYQRVLRASEEIPEGAKVTMVDSVEGAVTYLSGTEGNILVTTGSKEIAKFTALPEYKTRVYARVLSLPNVVSQCAQLGFEGAHLICMQGPFLKELNTAMLKQYNCRFLVTKEAGKNGGFEEKCLAARDAGAELVVIGRPRQEEGMSVEECKEFLRKQWGLCAKPQISLVGIGMGSEKSLTVEAMETLRRADCIIGGKRLVEAVASPSQEVYHAYVADEIKDYIDSHPQFRRVAVALSGDVGFYSGAKKLLDVLGEDTEVICGISSLVYFMSKIHRSWEDAAILSAHGRNCNLIHYIRHNEKTFAILGKKDSVAQLCRKLVFYGLEELTVYVGEDLSYDTEKIFSARPAELIDYEGSSLAVVCVCNAHPAPLSFHLKDEELIRGKAPMTKEDVRNLSTDKLQLTPDAICYDVGAGTGSVSMEMAMGAYDGKVYAIEKKADAVELIRQNKKKFALDNLEVIEGFAPEALEKLEAPTHAFIGGSSGNLRQIVELLLAKNPQVRIVINCITLETVTEALACIKELPLTEVEISQITAARAKTLASYHMMMGENPIYIISCKGGA